MHRPSSRRQRTRSLLKPTSSKHTSCLFFCQSAFWQSLLFVCFVLFQDRADVCLHKSSQTRDFSAEMNNLLDKHEPANRFFFSSSLLPASPRQIYSSETQWAPGINSAPPPHASHSHPAEACGAWATQEEENQTLALMGVWLPSGKI